MHNAARGEAMNEHPAWQNPGNEKIRELLSNAKTIAVVGCSPKPDRTSYRITSFLIEQGYQVIPVHPQADTILGQKTYASLADIPVPVDIVNVFRKSESTPPIAAAAASISAKSLWLQQGIFNKEAAKIATDADLICVMDMCIAIMHRMLLR